MSDSKKNNDSDRPDSGKLNKLRAAVLGANDGIVSVSSVVMGVAGATSDSKVIGLAGLAALVAGALSMAVGEYVSVSSQSDAEKAYIEKEKRDLRKYPERELDELAEKYQEHGLSDKLSRQVAVELTKKDALRAHLRMNFGLDPDEVVNPMHASIASLLSFTAGGAIPFLTIMFMPQELRIVSTVVAVVLALILLGYLSARASETPVTRVLLRVVVGGALAMLITYYVGSLLGVHI